ncbi:MAG: hypothetical protein AAF674_16745 [Pseudomonadota bacterium]
MADHPIIFSAPMIRALLEGRKTQTRRILSNAPPPGYVAGSSTFDDAITWVPTEDAFSGAQPVTQKWKGPVLGDRLWVREDWRTSRHYDDLRPSEMGGEEPVQFLADNAVAAYAGRVDDLTGRRRWSRHMPRWASRITLHVSDVRVQQLQEISEDDAEAEGVVCNQEIVDIVGTPHGPSEIYADRWRVPGVSPDDEEGFEDGIEAFAQLWCSINGETAWDQNPWVVALTFSVDKQNIDQVAA